MKELIKIEEREGIETVNARELYEFLKLEKAHWSRWCRKNIEMDAFFGDGVDYTGFTSMVNGNKSKNYYVTIDMAKELCMLARNEKGKEARRYFIECERKLKESTKPKIPQTYSEALLEAGRLAQENEILQLENNILLPKAQFYDDVTGSKDAIPMGNVSKVIACELGPYQLFSYLRKKKVLMRDNIPYQRFVDAKWFRVVESKFTDKYSGDIRINIKTLVYQKGIDGIIKSLRKDGFMGDE